MLKKVIVGLSVFLFVFTLVKVSTHALEAKNTGDGFSVNFSITQDVVSGSVTGKYSDGASVIVEARYKNTSGELSKIITRAGSPYISISLSEMPKIDDYENKSWVVGRSVGYPSSLNRSVSTTWIELAE